MVNAPRSSATAAPVSPSRHAPPVVAALCGGPVAVHRFRLPFRRMVRVSGVASGWVAPSAGAPVEVLGRRLSFAPDGTVRALSLWAAEIPLLMELGTTGDSRDSNGDPSRELACTLSLGLAGSPGDLRHSADILHRLPAKMRHLAPELSGSGAGDRNENSLTWHLERTRKGRTPERMTSELISQLSPWLANLPASDSSATIADVLGEAGGMPEYFGARLRRARHVLSDIPHTVAHGDMSRESLTVSGGEITGVTGWAHALPSAPVGFDAFSALADALGMRAANLREVTASGFWHHPSVVGQLRGIHSGYGRSAQRDALALSWAVNRWRLTDPAARNAGVLQVAGA